MVKRLSDESLSDKAQKQVSNKGLGVIYLFIAFLVILVGYIAHLTQTLMICPDVTYEWLMLQMDLYFFEYVIIGFFTGMFFVLGCLYLKKKEE